MGQLFEFLDNLSKECESLKERWSKLSEKKARVKLPSERSSGNSRSSSDLEVVVYSNAKVLEPSKSLDELKNIVEKLREENRPFCDGEPELDDDSVEVQHENDQRIELCNQFLQETSTVADPRANKTL